MSLELAAPQTDPRQAASVGHWRDAGPGGTVPIPFAGAVGRRVWEGSAGVNNELLKKFAVPSGIEVFLTYVSFYFFPQSESENRVSGPHVFLEVSHPGHKGQREHGESALLQGVFGGFKAGAFISLFCKRNSHLRKGCNFVVILVPLS